MQSVLLQGNKDGLRKLKLKIEDPPRRKHTGNKILGDVDSCFKLDLMINLPHFCMLTHMHAGMFIAAAVLHFGMTTRAENARSRLLHIELCTI